MQIHRNEDKAKVCRMTTDGRIRIFYPNKKSRDEAARLLKPIRDMMLDKTHHSRRIIQDAEESQAKVLNFAMQKSFKDFSAPSTRPSLAQMKQVVHESTRLLNTGGPTSFDREKYQSALKDKTVTQMSDPSIRKIDNHADTGVFGIEVPEKLFWGAFIARNDITREEGSEYGEFDSTQQIIFP